MKDPSDKDGKGRESDVWFEDLDEASELAEFRGAASALEEFRDSSMPYEAPEQADDELEEISGLDSALDEAFEPDNSVAYLDPSSPVPGSPVPSGSPVPGSMSPIPASMSPIPSMGQVPPGSPAPSPFGQNGVPQGNVSPPPAKRTWVIPAVIMATILGISAVVVTIIVTTQTETPNDSGEGQGSQFILIKGNVVPEGGELRTGDASAVGPSGTKGITPTQVEAGTAPSSPDAGENKVVTPVKISPGEPQGSDVSKAFSGQRRRIAKCFDTHARGGPNVPMIDIHFALEGDGSIREILLRPESVGGTPLGGCLRSVASSTRFPAPGKAVEFSIPIKARRVE